MQDNGAWRDAIQMLIDRTAEGDAMAIADIRFGLDTLLEAETVMRDVPPGRRGILTDIKHKLAKVEGEHTPETIAELSRALQAFLDEELADEKKEESMSMEEANKTEGQEESKRQEEVRCEACGASMGKKETLPPVMEAKAKPEDEEDEKDEKNEKPATEREAKTEEGCHEAKEEEGMTEAIAELRAQVSHLTQRLEEAEKPTPQRFTEADRRELDELRTWRAKSEATTRAAVALKEAGLEGVYTPDELMEYREAQWPSMVKTWANATPPQRFGVPQVTTEAPAARQEPLTGTAYFSQFFTVTE